MTNARKTKRAISMFLDGDSIKDGNGKTYTIAEAKIAYGDGSHVEDCNLALRRLIQCEWDFAKLKAYYRAANAARGIS